MGWYGKELATVMSTTYLRKFVGKENCKTGDL